MIEPMTVATPVADVDRSLDKSLLQASIHRRTPWIAPVLTIEYIQNDGFWHRMQTDPNPGDSPCPYGLDFT